MKMTIHTPFTGAYHSSDLDSHDVAELLERIANLLSEGSEQYVTHFTFADCYSGCVHYTQINIPRDVMKQSLVLVQER